MGRVGSAERCAAPMRAALQVIDRAGVHAATMRMVVAEAGMSLASLYYAFRSRDEIMRELVAFVVADEQRVSLEALDPTADIRSAVRAGIQAYFEMLRAHPSREQALPELVQYSLRTPELEHLVRAQYASYFRTAKVLLERGAENAERGWSLPVEELARILIAITDGLTVARLADRDDEAADTLIDFAADTFGALAMSRRALAPKSS